LIYLAIYPIFSGSQLRSEGLVVRPGCQVQSKGKVRSAEVIRLRIPEESMRVDFIEAQRHDNELKVVHQWLQTTALHARTY
jgi:hypothetical protein